MTGSDLRVRKRELFRTLGYDPHPGQIEVHKSRAQRRVLACGARWGKSTCAAMEAVAALLAPCEESLGWLVAPNYGLTERIFCRVEAAVTGHLEHRVVDLNSMGRVIVLRNLGGGLSELRCKSADNPASLLGEGLNWLIIDEAARLRDDTWSNYLSQRLLDQGGWALILSTPQGCNWFFKLYRAARKDPLFQCWSSPSWDNPILRPELIEEERKRLTPEVFAQEYGAEFVGAPPIQCDTCGGPDPDVPDVYLNWRGTEMDKCPECGEQVDEKGRTVVHLNAHNEPYVKIISLCTSEGNPVDPSLVPSFLRRYGDPPKQKIQGASNADQGSVGGIPPSTGSGRKVETHT